MKLYSVIEKKELLPSATPCMDLKGIMLSEKSDREIQILYDITYMWNLKNTKKQISEYNKKEIFTGIENRLMVTSEETEQEGQWRGRGLTGTNY